MPDNYNSKNVFGIGNEKNPKNHSVRSDEAVNDLMKTFRNADILTCNADELVDLKTVETNRKKPLSSRANDFIAQVGNPYLFRVDDVVVKVEFGNGKDFSEILTDVILAG